MSGETATISILCNPPKGFRGDIEFIIGHNDEIIGKGRVDETIDITLPLGKYNLLALVKNEGLNSLSDTTLIELNGNLSLKFKYHFFSKRANLVLNKD